MGMVPERINIGSFSRLSKLQSQKIFIKWEIIVFRGRRKKLRRPLFLRLLNI